MRTTIEPRSAHKGNSYDAYEYTAHSHTFETDATPSMRVTYDLSPIQVGSLQSSKAVHMQAQSGGKVSCVGASRVFFAGVLLLKVTVGGRLVYY